MIVQVPFDDWRKLKATLDEIIDLHSLTKDVWGEEWCKSCRMALYPCATLRAIETIKSD